MPRRLRTLLTAMSIGALVGVSLVSMLGFDRKQFLELPVLGASALAGALMAAIFAIVQPRQPRAMSRGRAIGCGLAYAALGFWSWAIILLVPALMTGSELAINGCAPALIILFTFSSLGLVFGLGFHRLALAESERQRAALARQELDLARDVQQRLLPPPTLEGKGFRAAAKNIPAAWVAGDFYDFIPLEDGRLLVVLCDVAGKGVAAGLIVASTKAVLPLLAERERSASRVLRLLNDKLSRELSRREFVAVILAIYDPATGALEIANAGMPDAVLVHISLSRAIESSGPRYPAGIRANLAYESTQITLAHGDRVVFFSDGLPEARGMNGAQFGYERVLEEIAHAATLDELFAKFESLVDGEHEDDWTAVQIARVG